MSFFQRLHTLIRADAHGVVDALEDKSLLLKQTLREAGLALEQKRARVETLGSEEKRLREADAESEARIAALDADIQLALTQGKPDLAKFSIRKLLPLRREQQARQARLVALAEEHEETSAMLAEQEGEFESLKVRVREHLARLEAANEDQDLECFVGPAVAEEEVELELLRRQEGGAKATVKKGDK